MVRLTIQRLGKTANPFAASDRLTIAPLICRQTRFNSCRNCAPWEPPSEYSLSGNGDKPKSVLIQQNTAITILDIGGVYFRMSQYTSGLR
jgi:hypothetical protein